MRVQRYRAMFRSSRSSMLKMRNSDQPDSSFALERAFFESIVSGSRGRIETQPPSSEHGGALSKLEEMMNVDRKRIGSGDIVMYWLYAELSRLPFVVAVALCCCSRCVVVRTVVVSRNGRACSRAPFTHQEMQKRRLNSSPFFNQWWWANDEQFLDDHMLARSWIMRWRPSTPRTVEVESTLLHNFIKAMFSTTLQLVWDNVNKRRMED